MRLWRLFRARYARDGRRRPHGVVPYRSPRTEEKTRETQDSATKLTVAVKGVGVTAQQAAESFRQLRIALGQMEVKRDE